MSDIIECFDFDDKKNFTSWSADREANIWATFYLTFNDNNINHMYSAFDCVFRDVDFTKDMSDNEDALTLPHLTKWDSRIRVAIKPRTRYISAASISS